MLPLKLNKHHLECQPLMFWERRAVGSILSCFKLTCKSAVLMHTRSKVRNIGNNGPVKQVPQKSVHAGDEKLVYSKCKLNCNPGWLL